MRTPCGLVAIAVQSAHETRTRLLDTLKSCWASYRMSRNSFCEGFRQTAGHPVSRRHLLQGGLVTAAAALSGMAWAALPQPGPARAWRTDAHAKHAPLPLSDWQPGVRSNVPDLVVDGATKRQPILGFGACLTDSSCYLLSRMPAAQRDALLHELYSSREANFSVGRGCVGSSDLVGGWATWAASMARILTSGARNITLWNLLPDEHGEPEIGPYEIGGTITLNSKTGELERNGQYWALRHYAAHLRRGARRLDTHTGDLNFTQVAFQNPDGEYVLVMTNQSTPRDVLVLSGGRILEVPLATNSVTTVTWQTGV